MNRATASERGGMALNVLLVVLLAALIALHWLVLPDPSRRNVEFLPEMVDSVPRSPQDPVGVLVAGLLPDLRPPDGAIARGHLPLGYEASPEEALRAGRELRSPLPADDTEALQRGAFVFTQFCAVCHGPAGAGDGPATRRGVPPPPSLLLDKARQMPDGQMFHLISLGGGNMASYASQIQRDDRWKVILHVRALQEQADATEGATETPAGDAIQDPAANVPEGVMVPATEGMTEPTPEEAHGVPAHAAGHSTSGAEESGT